MSCSSPEIKKPRLDQQSLDCRPQVLACSFMFRMQLKCLFFTNMNMLRLPHVTTSLQDYVISNSYEQFLQQFSSCCGICMYQLSAAVDCSEISTLERKLLDVMNDICDLLGSVRVDEWLSVPSSLAANIQRLLLQRCLVSFVALV